MILLWLCLFGHLHYTISFTLSLLFLCHFILQLALLICPDFTNFCDNDTTFAILLLTTICKTTHKQCRGLVSPETGRRISAKQKLRRSPTPKFYRRKIASLFADFTLQKDTVKAVQSFPLRHRFDFVI